MVVQIVSAPLFVMALAALKEELSFIKDGHFYIGEAVESAPIHGTINK